MRDEPRSPTTQNRKARFHALPGGIWALGFVSLFMDISSEMIHSLLPVFLVTVMGAGALSVGIIEGVAEATASISRIFSGTLSDWLGRRKALVLMGYGLSALTKPLFALAPSVGWVFAARFADRIGKGIRGAPRDALIGDILPLPLRGAGYGLRQSLDTVGAFAGPLLATVLMAATGDNFRAVFWFTVVPALIAVTILWAGVREPERVHRSNQVRFPLHPAELYRLGSGFWWVLALAAGLTLARFSEAFLLLRADSVGLSVTLIPLVLVVMNVVYSVAAYPIGVLSDAFGRVNLLIAGCGVLVLADLVLALSTAVWQVMGGAMLWGLHMGMTQGLLAAIIADTVPAELRGTAFGVFHFVTGLVLLLASVLAGLLWSVVGPSATFLAGAGFTLLATLGFAYRYRWR